MNELKENITPRWEVQVQTEIEGWKRALSFMIDENIHLKARLTTALKNELTKNSLEKAEEFHAQFLKQDQLTGLLRNEIAELDIFLVSPNKKMLGEIKTKLTKLRSNMNNAAREFDQLRTSFSDYITAQL